MWNCRVDNCFNFLKAFHKIYGAIYYCFKSFHKIYSVICYLFLISYWFTVFEKQSIWNIYHLNIKYLSKIFGKKNSKNTHLMVLNFGGSKYYAKNVQIRSFFWSVFPRIQSKNDKIGTRKTPYLDNYTQSKYCNICSNSKFGTTVLHFFRCCFFTIIIYVYLQ